MASRLEGDHGGRQYLYRRPAEQRPGRTPVGDQPHESGRLERQEEERELVRR